MVEAIKETAYTAFRASLMRRDALFIDNIWLLHLSQLSEWSMDAHPTR